MDRETEGGKRKTPERKRQPKKTVSGDPLLQETVAIQEEADGVNRLNPEPLTQIAKKSGEGNNV
jgi:hypothetical protein